MQSDKRTGCLTPRGLTLAQCNTTPWRRAGQIPAGRGLAQASQTINITALIFTSSSPMVFSRRFTACWLATAALAFVTSTQATAADIVVKNYNFEANPLADGQQFSGQIPDWVKVGSAGSGYYNPNKDYYSNPAILDAGSTGGLLGTMNGPNVAYMFLGGGTTLTNTTATAVVIGTTYVLTAAVGQRNNGQVFTPVTLELLGGGVTLALTTVNSAPALNSFGDVSLSYTAQAGDTGLIGIRLGLPSGSVYADFDNVRLTSTTTPVPEPISAALMALGLAAMAGRWRHINALSSANRS